MGKGGHQIITPPRPDLSGANEGALGSAAAGMLAAAAPFASYGAGYQLLPQQMMGQVYVPGPNPTLMGNPYQSSEGFYGPSPAPPTGWPLYQSYQPTSSPWMNQGYYGQGGALFNPWTPSTSPAMALLYQLAQGASRPVGARPSNSGFP